MKYWLLYILILCCFSCEKAGTNIVALSKGETQPVYIKRFDKELYAHLINENYRDFNALQKTYPEFWDIYAESILGIGRTDTGNYTQRLLNYFNNEDIQILYKDALNQFDDIEDIRRELTSAFNQLTCYIPSIKIPDFYMHVSGLNQSVVVGDNYISLSIDKYLGKDYYLYQTTFYSYERRYMHYANVTKDYLTGWYYSEYPYDGTPARIIDNMLHHGKLYYLYSLLFPKWGDKEIMDYTEEEVKWLEKHEKQLWTSIINDKKLFQSDPLYVSKLISDAPFRTFGLTDCPGRVGAWLGMKIIRSYVSSNHEMTLSELLSENDYNKILEKSKYNPGKKK